MARVLQNECETMRTILRFFSVREHLVRAGGIDLWLKVFAWSLKMGKTLRLRVVCVETIWMALLSPAVVISALYFFVFTALACQGRFASVQLQDLGLNDGQVSRHDCLRISKTLQLPTSCVRFFLTVIVKGWCSTFVWFMRKSDIHTVLGGFMR